MDQAQAAFLQILQAAMRGEPCTPDIRDADEFQRVMRLAAIQNVLPMVCEAIYTAPCAEQYGAAFTRCRQDAVSTVVSQTVRTAQFADLHAKLGQAGLRPIIVKGLAIRRLYPREQLRPSVDEDLLIRSEEMERYHAVLSDYGMVPLEAEYDLQNDPEVAYTHPDSGLYIEVHKHLLPPDSKAYGDLNRFFEALQPTEFAYRGQTMLTLQPTDHAFFLICHSLKHFLHSGFGIRQVGDLALFSHVHADEIDWDRLRRQCAEIDGEAFAHAMYRIGSRYLLPDNRYEPHLTDWSGGDTDTEALLQDILASGVHGASELNRLHSSNITLAAVADQKSGGNGKASVWRSLFLPLDAMRGRYTYLEKAPFLLPLAWSQRALHYAKELSARRSGAGDAVESMKLGRQRVELLKQYGILKP